MGIGKRIKEKSKEKGLSVKEVSQRAGVPYTTLYSIIKRDSDRVDPITLAKIADTLEVSLLDLATGKRTYGEKLKQDRLNRGITLHELAQVTQISEDALQKYENDEIEPGIEIMRIIANALQVDDLETKEYLNKMPTISDYIRTARKISGKTRKELAEAINESEETIQQLEEDRITISYTQNQKLAKALGLKQELLIDLLEITRTNEEKNEVVRRIKNRNDILAYFDDLTLEGQEEAINNIKLLLRIPEYNIYTTHNRENKQE